jgi:DNA replication protein DnaC
MTTTSSSNHAKTAANGRDVTELAYLTRALKAPALRDAVDRLAERARSEGWSHEEHLVACLQREVAARDAHGAEGRIRAARFPSRKSIEDFDPPASRSRTSTSTTSVPPAARPSPTWEPWNSSPARRT